MTTTTNNKNIKRNKNTVKMEISQGIRILMTRIKLENNCILIRLIIIKKLTLLSENIFKNKLKKKRKKWMIIKNGNSFIKNSLIPKLIS